MRETDRYATECIEKTQNQHVRVPMTPRLNKTRFLESWLYRLRQFDLLRLVMGAIEVDRATDTRAPFGFFDMRDLPELIDNINSFVRSFQHQRG